ncbi:hypothetical protein Zmor_005008 [Zophobas morio]|uniref:Uncharacterized protein n=1 Tax=Zophobas morio TaxID=2755281 RepID=A0AA38IUF3_9CUCU|nr:hypothetical protein Zmor_005008 [Zophobas morio]
MRPPASTCILSRFPSQTSSFKVIYVRISEPSDQAYHLNIDNVDLQQEDISNLLLTHISNRVVFSLSPLLLINSGGGMPEKLATLAEIAGSDM